MSVAPVPAAWTCIDCGTRYPQRVAWCSSCGAQGRCLLLGVRPTASIDLEPETATAASLAALAGEPVPVAAYPTLKVGHGALVVLWGPPGGGKSSMAARWLDALTGPVLYVAHEEGLGPTLASRLARLGVRRRDFRLLGRATVDQTVAEIRRHHPVAVAIDSVQAGVWEARDLRHLLALHPQLAVVLAVCQVNARGVPEGRRTLAHEADVVIHIEALTVTLTKSRYQEISDGNGTIDVPVLPRSTPNAGDAVRREGATLLHLRRVLSTNLPPGDSEPRRTGDGEPRDRSPRGEDPDRPCDVGASTGDATPRRAEPAADHDTDDPGDDDRGGTDCRDGS